MWNHAQIHSCNQPVLSNEGKVSCPRKQWDPLMGLIINSLPGIYFNHWGWPWVRNMHRSVTCTCRKTSCKMINKDKHCSYTCQHNINFWNMKLTLCENSNHHFLRINIFILPFSDNNIFLDIILSLFWEGGWGGVHTILFFGTKYLI